MISVKQAKEIVSRASERLQPVKTPVSKALKLVLAEDIIAPVSMPPFHQSAMDGYAFAWGNGTTFRIYGESAAGDGPFDGFSNETAIRIFTGAMVPAGADTVVRQEDVGVAGDQLIINKMPSRKGANVRLQGAQIRKGELALTKGSILNPAAIGFIAGLGVSEINVYPAPLVSVIITGSELVSPGQDLLPGQLYESNSFSLEGALRELNIKDIYTTRLKDDLEDTQKKIGLSIEASDIILVTGGISVGDHDYVGPALKKLGVEQLFYKVSQKPGKPLFFGRHDGCLIFALPGNPASALVGFYEYVAPCINAIMDMPERPGRFLTAKLKNPVSNHSPRDCFLRSRLKNGVVEILEGQDSFIMRSFANANCLVFLPAKCGELQENDIVEAHRITDF